VLPRTVQPRGGVDGSRIGRGGADVAGEADSRVCRVRARPRVAGHPDLAPCGGRRRARSFLLAARTTWAARSQDPGEKSGVTAVRRFVRARGMAHREGASGGMGDLFACRRAPPRPPAMAHSCETCLAGRCAGASSCDRRATDPTLKRHRRARSRCECDKPRAATVRATRSPRSAHRASPVHRDAPTAAPRSRLAVAATRVRPHSLAESPLRHAPGRHGRGRRPAQLAGFVCYRPDMRLSPTSIGRRLPRTHLVRGSEAPGESPGAKWKMAAVGRGRRPFVHRGRALCHCGGITHLTEGSAAPCHLSLRPSPGDRDGAAAGRLPPRRSALDNLMQYVSHRWGRDSCPPLVAQTFLSVTRGRVPAFVPAEATRSFSASFGRLGWQECHRSPTDHRQECLCHRLT